MNDPIFSQMKEQLIPSPAARAALEEGLSRPVRPPRPPVLGAGRLPPSGGRLPLGHALLSPPLHSYVTVEEAAGAGTGRQYPGGSPPPRPHHQRERTWTGHPPRGGGGAVRPQPASRLRPGRRLPCPAAAQRGGRDLFRCRRRRGRPAPGAPDSGDPTGIRQRHLPGLVRWRLSGQRGRCGGPAGPGLRHTGPAQSGPGLGRGRGVLCPGPCYSLASLTKLQEQDLCPALSEGGAVLLRPGREEQPSGPVPH